MRELRALKRTVLLLCVLAGLIARSPASAQENPITVPDVTGLSVPAAAALLNRNGMALGLQSEEPWTDGLGLSPGTIAEQSLAPGTTVAPGTALDITIARSPNVLLVYGPQVFTLVNQSAAAVDLRKLLFTALDGDTAAAFPAANWMATLDGGGQCAQLWAEPRTTSERLPECTGVQRWLSTVNTSAHFWTGLNGVTRFNVVYDGEERAVCAAATRDQERQQCAFFLPMDAAAGDATAYIYLAYTTDRLIVLNQSSDQWMPLAQTTVFNYNANVSVQGAALDIGDPGLYNADIVADVTRLAPGQCLLYTNSSPEATAPPQPCDVIARLAVDPRLVFWAADFEIGSESADQRYTCPAATANKMTICVMPR